jgi:hypothetical protein
VRNGLILGTVPETESGRWKLLKSSADGNPGNSGGPLVTPAGKVVGLVTSLRDNILYSTPASVIMNYQRGVIQYRNKIIYNHTLLANKLTKTFETETPTNQSYKTAQTAIVNKYKTAYVDAMTNLFNEAPEYLTGDNSAYLLYASTSSVFPQVDFVDRNDDNWKLSRLDTKYIDLNDDGRLIYSNISDINLFKINRPKSVPLEKLDTNPRFIMDTILQNWRLERTLTQGDKYRILSFGEPLSVKSYKDNIGRTWIKTHWLIAFDDKIVVVYILPLPGGPAVISTVQSSEELSVYEWDIEKICDHIHSAYSGSLTEWNDFLKLPKYKPDFLKNFSYDWDSAAKSVKFSLDNFSVDINNSVFDWNEISELYMLPSYYKAGNTVEFAVNKVIMNRNTRRRDLFVLEQNTKPDSRLGPDYREEWDDILEERFPYNGKVALSQKDNNGTIGSLLPAIVKLDDVRWTLYMAMEDPTEEDLAKRFESLKSGIVIQK